MKDMLYRRLATLCLVGGLVADASNQLAHSGPAQHTALWFIVAGGVAMLLVTTNWMLRR